MPKIIDKAKTKIIECAKNRMFSEEFESLSLRSIANDCDMAVGTIYNYFKDKETLIATIMLEDWKLVLEKLDAACDNSQSVVEGFESFYETIREFCMGYENIWMQSKGAKLTQSRHQLLITQIKERVIVLLEKFNLKSETSFSTIIAESVLSSAVHKIDEKEFIDFINYLFNRKD